MSFIHVQISTRSICHKLLYSRGFEAYSFSTGCQYFCSQAPEILVNLFESSRKVSQDSAPVLNKIVRSSNFIKNSLPRRFIPKQKAFCFGLRMKLFSNPLGSYKTQKPQSFRFAASVLWTQEDSNPPPLQCK